MRTNKNRQYNLIKAQLLILLIFASWAFCPRLTAQSEFITTWKSDNPGSANNTITIDVPPNSYNIDVDFTVDWGDGMVDMNVIDDITHTYAVADTYTVKITGDFSIWSQNNPDVKKLLTVEQWGNIQWETMNRAFYKCENLQVNAIDTPDLSNVTSMQLMFYNCFSMNADIGHWDVSTIDDMLGTFYGAQAFNQDLNDWDLSDVTTTKNMFREATAFNGDISDWELSNVTDLSGMFADASSFDRYIGDWNVSSGQLFGAMFWNAFDFDQDIGSWDVGSATNMVRMFQGADEFNQDIGTWDMSDVTTTQYMFSGAVAFDQNLGNWDVGNVNLMADMFSGAGLSSENYDSLLIGWYGLPSLQNNVAFDAGNSMYCEGKEARDSIMQQYNWTINDGGETPDCGPEPGDYFITTWKTDNHGTSADDQITIPIEGTGYDYEVDWGDGTIESFITSDGSPTHTYALADTYTVMISGSFPRIYFNNTGDRQKLLSIEQWGTIEWSTMQNAFFGCTKLQGYASDAPDLSHVANLAGMFRRCSLFNDSTLQAWDVQDVRNMRSMFRGAHAFDQDIGTWDVGKVTNMAKMFLNAGLSTANYDNLLIGWGGLPSLESNVQFDAGESTYCFGEAARENLVLTHGWVISDGGEAPGCNTGTEDQFVTTWKTDNPGSSANNQITIPIEGGGYNYEVDWGDGTVESFITSDGSPTHTYAFIDTYTVRISGSFPRIYFNNTGDRLKLLNIVQWGSASWASMKNAFYGCANLQGHASDVPDLTGVTKTSGMFRECSMFNDSTLGDWDMSNINTMANMFRGAANFNTDIGDWEVGSVWNMVSLFRDASTFDQDISSWEVGGVTDMRAMFDGAESFNQDISSWDVSGVILMDGVFKNATAFNQNINTWEVDNVTSMSGMFNGASAFNQDIGDWDVSNVGNMGSMFKAAASFDQDIGDWDVSSVTYMAHMFLSAGLGVSNYDSLLIKWSELPGIQNGVTFNAGASMFCAGANARDSLTINHGWSITDGGLWPMCPEPLNQIATDTIYFLNGQWSGSISTTESILVFESDFDSGNNEPAEIRAQSIIIGEAVTVTIREGHSLICTEHLFNKGTLRVYAGAIVELEGKNLSPF